MTDQWYYTQDDVKSGPCSAVELKELAAAGIILPTDTISREGVVQGKLAKFVKNLFLSSAPETPVIEAAPLLEDPAEDGPLTTDALVANGPEVKAPERFPAKPPQLPEKKKGRALAVQGVVILNQDGFEVNYRKKCSVCAHEDACRHRMAIRSGITRSHFFCQKCRKARPVVIQCMGG